MIRLDGSDPVGEERLATWQQRWIKGDKVYFETSRGWRSGVLHYRGSVDWEVIDWSGRDVWQVHESQLHRIYRANAAGDGPSDEAV